MQTLMLFCFTIKKKKIKDNSFLLDEKQYRLLMRIRMVHVLGLGKLQFLKQFN